MAVGAADLGELDSALLQMATQSIVLIYQAEPMIRTNFLAVLRRKSQAKVENLIGKKCVNVIKIITAHF
ncbi:hypothetical protein D3C87_1726550 [compost metagenome]